MIIRTTHHLKEVRISEEIEIVLTSRAPSAMSASDIQTLRRGHWTIENALHYVRDVTLGEDASTVSTLHAPQNLAALRNLVIGLCALDAARQRKTTSHMPRFRTAAKNDRQVAIDLLTRPLLNGS